MASRDEDAPLIVLELEGWADEEDRVAVGVVSDEAIRDAEEERSVVEVVGVTGLENSCGKDRAFAVGVAPEADDVGEVISTPGGVCIVCKLGEDERLPLAVRDVWLVLSPRGRGGGILEVDPPGVRRRGW